MLVPNILKVVYAPHKAFKEIAENPRYAGPFLALLLLVAANIAFSYTAVSKTYFEQILPDGSKLDEWTENKTYWTSNALVTESDDHVSGNYFGNESIQFSLNDSMQMQMNTSGIGSINCSGADGYNKLSFRVKLTSPTTLPQNVIINAISANSSGYFSRNLDSNFSSSASQVWNNITIELANQEWTTNGIGTSWDNITGLELQFTWTENSNATILVDGLFFHGPFKSLLETSGSSYLFNFAFISIVQYVVTWVILTGLIYLMAKIFGGQLVWKPLLIVVGAILIVLFVQAAVNAVSYSTLSPVRYPFELIIGVQGEGSAASDAIFQQTLLVTEISRYTMVAVYIWTIALCVLAVRLLSGFTWTKSFLVGAVAYFMNLVIGSFLLGS